jgi:hypothetical protein
VNVQWGVIGVLFPCFQDKDPLKQKKLAASIKLPFIDACWRQPFD